MELSDIDRGGGPRCGARRVIHGDRTRAGRRDDAPPEFLAVKAVQRQEGHRLVPRGHSPAGHAAGGEAGGAGELGFDGHGEQVAGGGRRDRDGFHEPARLLRVRCHRADGRDRGRNSIGVAILCPRRAGAAGRRDGDVHQSGRPGGRGDGDLGRSAGDDRARNATE